MAMPPHLLLLEKDLGVNFILQIKLTRYLRVQSWGGILDLLDEAGHVLEKEIVKMLLLHVFELESRFARLRHDEVM